VVVVRYWANQRGSANLPMILGTVLLEPALLAPNVRKMDTVAKATPRQKCGDGML